MNWHSWSEFISQLTKAFVACKMDCRPLDAQTKMDYLMDKTQPSELAAAKEVACVTHPNDFAAAANCIGDQVSWTISAAVWNRAHPQNSQ